MATPRPTLPEPPEPYESQDPALTGHVTDGRDAPPVVEAGRTTVTAAGERIGTAPDLDLGPSGGGAGATPPAPVPLGAGRTPDGRPAIVTGSRDRPDR